MESMPALMPAPGQHACTDGVIWLNIIRLQAQTSTARNAKPDKALIPESGPRRRCATLEAENRELDFRRALDVQGFVADISLVRQQQAANARHAPSSLTAVMSLALGRR